MKNLLCLIPMVFSLGMFISCGDDETAANDSGNAAPGSFTVTSSAGSTTASLSWSASIDPDGDDVIYIIELEDSIVVTGLVATDYDFTDLTPETSYSGSVIATDGNGGETSDVFSFTTIAQGGNANPGAFTVTADNITHNSASLSWGESVDPDGDPVTYEVTLGGETLSSNITATTYDLTDLRSGVTITGTVVATDGNDGETESDFSFTSYVIDISQYESMTGFVSAALVDCTYKQEEGGGTTTCYEITFTANNVDDDNTHLCPETTNDIGGLGNYDGDGVDNGSAQNGDAVGLSILNGAFFEKMENDGFDIISNEQNGDGSFDIKVYDFEGAVVQPACLEAAPDDALTLTFQIPVVPDDLSSPDNIESVEYIGLAFDGTPINGTPPSVVDNNGNIPSLDRCGGHQDPAGYYHWHFIAQNMNTILDDYGFYEENVFECEHIAQSTTALMGYARDGYPIYSSHDADGTPSDLDGCNGHFGETAEYPDGVYHYHASEEAPNVPPCVVGKQSRDAFVKPM